VLSPQALCSAYEGRKELAVWVGLAMCMHACMHACMAEY